MRNKYAGSSFDEFLKEEGIEAEVVARAAKRTFTKTLKITNLGPLSDALVKLGADVGGRLAVRPN